MRLCLLFILLLSAGLSRASDSAAFRAGEVLFSNGRYNEAWTEYQRSLYFKETAASVLNERMGYCRYFAGNLESAFEHFRTAEVMRSSEVSSSSDSIRLQYRFIQAELQILLGTREKSLKRSRFHFEKAGEIIHGNPVPDNKIQSGKSLLYKGFINLLLDDFEESRNSFRLYAQEFDPGLTGRIDSLFCVHQKKISRIKPGLAGTMSLIIPGSGQFYAGKPLSGLNSLLLTGAIGFLLYRVAVIYSPEIAVLALASPLIRYYAGGAGNARRQAHDLRMRRKETAMKEISALIESRTR